MTIDIVIISHGRPKELEACLNALCPQLRETMNAQIIVYNDGSDSPAYDKAIASHRDRISYICLTKMPTIGALRKLAVEQSEADYLVFTDDDCMPPESWLDWFVATIRANPAVDLFAAPARYPDERAESFGDMVARVFEAHPSVYFDGPLLRLAATANVAYKVKTLKEVGNFDPRLATSEDWNITLRVMRGGGTFLIENSIATVHSAQRDTLGLFKKLYTYGYGQAMHAVYMQDSSASRSWKYSEMVDFIRGAASLSALKYFAEARGQRYSLISAAAASFAIFGLLFANWLGFSNGARASAKSLKTGVPDTKSPEELIVDFDGA